MIEDLREDDRMTPGAEDKAWLAIDDRSSADDLPEDLVGLVKPELQPGERLLWVSRANQAGPTRGRGGHRVAGTWAFGFLAGSVGCIALSLGSDPRVRQAEVGLVAFGVLLGAIGLLVAIGTFASLVSTLRDIRHRGRRIYAVTDRRAVLWSPVANSDAVTVHVFPRGSIRPEQIERTQFPDGSGTLSIQGPYTPHGRFEGIADVRRVEELVRRFLIAPEPGSAP